MLSAQVDRLRELATRCNKLQVGETRVVRVPSDMGSILSEAADTIWQLRDGLQQANAENEKLIVKLNAEHIVRQNVEIENDRLRKVCAELAEFLTEAEWLQWPELRAEMRELGIEVGA